MVKLIVCVLLVLTSITALNGQTIQTHQDFVNSGSAHLQAGELDAALSDANKAIELNPGSVDAYVLRALVRNRMNYEADDLEDWDKIIELAPSAPDTESSYLARANSRARRQKWNDALDDLGRAISLNPKRAIHYSLRSYVYLMKGDLDRARIDYERSLEIEPGLPSPFVRRGYFRTQTLDFAGAQSDYSKAIAWKPDYPEAYADRGISHGLQGNIDDAVKDLRRAAAMNPHSISDKVPGLTFASPFWELNTFSDLYPTNARAHQLLGCFRLLQQKEAEALQHFSRALSLEPALRTEIDQISAALRP
jgi:tetratricopeptide (TPR) repeat protein